MGLLPSQMASLLLFFCPCLCFHYVLFFFICKPPNIKIIAFVFVLSQKDKSSSPKVGLLYVCWWQVWKVWVLSVSVRRVCRNHLYMVSCMRRCAHVCVYTLGIPACLSHSQPTVWNFNTRQAPVGLETMKNAFERASFWWQLSLTTLFSNTFHSAFHARKDFLSSELSFCRAEQNGDSFLWTQVVKGPQ